jgi:hypothetical protein
MSIIRCPPDGRDRYIYDNESEGYGEQTADAELLKRGGNEKDTAVVEILNGTVSFPARIDEVDCVEGV